MTLGTPLIGLTTYVADTRWGGWERRSGVLPESYYELVAAAGGRPMLLPPTGRAPGGPGTAADEVVANHLSRTGPDKRDGKAPQ